MIDGVIILAVGLRGSGKTSQIRRLTGYASPAGPALCTPRRLIVCDPEKRWAPEAADLVVEGAGALVAALEAAGARDPRRAFRLIYHDDAESMQLAGPGAAYAYRHLTLAIDELVWLCHAHHLPKYLKLIVQVGRERGINLLGTTREPQEVHDLLFSQALLVYFFHTEPGNGLDRIRRRYPRIAGDLESLAAHQYRTHSTGSESEVLAFIGREGLAPTAAAPHQYSRSRHRRR